MHPHEAAASFTSQTLVFSNIDKIMEGIRDRIFKDFESDVK